MRPEALAAGGDRSPATPVGPFDTLLSNRHHACMPTTLRPDRELAQRTAQTGPMNGPPILATTRRQARRLAHIGCLAALGSLAVVSHCGENAKVQWNQFRGPNGQGVASADRIPTDFGPNRGVLWQAPVPPGHSSPVIWDDRGFRICLSHKER